MNSSAPSSASSAGVPPRKKNAASQFRSRRQRISHPLFDAPSTSSGSSSVPSTPPRSSAMPVTPEPPRSPSEPPALLDALKMAARPSSAPSNGGGENNASGAAALPPRPSYTSSIEAMAAHVEASHITKRRTTKKPPYSPRLKNIKSSSSGSLSNGSGKSSSGKSRKSKKAAAATPAAASPNAKIWLIAIPILLPFLVCEGFLWLLVFRFKDSVATGEIVLGASDIDVPKVVNVRNEIPVSVEDRVDKDESETLEELEVIKEDVGDIENKTDLESSSIEESLLTEQGDSDEEEHRDETGIQPKETPNEELMRLQSMLEEGFAKLRGSVVGGQDGTTSRKSVESLCGNVWVVANDMFSSESLTGEVGAGGESEVAPSGSSGAVHLEGLSQRVPNSWKSLALDAQHCLGGAGLAFLSKEDVDGNRLRVSTKVFDRLSSVEPYNPNVRAGLGTSLLIHGIFNLESIDNIEKAEDAQRSLTLAAYHLKMASSLCSSADSATAVAEDTDNASNDIAPTASQYENAATHAAILHNLALAYLALGDKDSAVPILLRAAALCRGHSINTKPYWNAPHDVLQAAEEKALLIAAKHKKSETAKKRRRIPFLPFRSEDI